MSGTKFNGISMLGTSKISFTAGVTDDGGTISLTTGTISSVASTTEASNADTSGAALAAEVALNLGEISGGFQSLRARENVAFAASAIMSAAATSTSRNRLCSRNCNINKKI